MFDWLRNLFKKLTVNVEGDGSTYPTPGTRTFFRGTRIQISAYPKNGSILKEWTGDAQGSSNPTSLVMNMNKTVTAIFTRILNTITVSITGSGTVIKAPDSPNGYTPGTSVVLTATPAVGWQFASWTLPDGSTSTDNPVTVVA